MSNPRSAGAAVLARFRDGLGRRLELQWRSWECPGRADRPHQYVLALREDDSLPAWECKVVEGGMTAERAMSLVEHHVEESDLTDSGAEWYVTVLGGDPWP